MSSYYAPSECSVNYAPSALSECPVNYAPSEMKVHTQKFETGNKESNKLLS